MSAHFEDPDSQYINMSEDIPTLNGTSGATLAAWVYSFFNDSMQILGFSIGNATITSGTRAAIKMGSADKFQVQARNGTDGGTLVTSTGTVVAAEDGWYFVCGVIDLAGDIMRLYVGAPDGSSLTLDEFAVDFTISSWPSTDSRNGAFAAEEDGGSTYWNGLHAEYQVYDHPLSDAEVRSLYAMRGPPASYQGLVHRFSLLEGAPTTTITQPRDSGPGQMISTPVNTPIYGFEHPFRTRRPFI